MSRSLLWLRQDLRLSDQPALAAAVDEGEMVPVYVLDDAGPGGWAIGGAQRWWLHHSLSALEQSFRKRGGYLVLRKGETVEVLAQIAREVGTRRVHAIRHYEPWHRAAETAVAGTLDLELHDGNHLIAPNRVMNGKGERYRVFTPWFRRLLEQPVPLDPLPPPEAVRCPADMPASDSIESWNLLPSAPDWSVGFAEWRPGEKGAWSRWRAFGHELARYAKARDVPSVPGTSKLSPHLHFGEISVRSLWAALADERGDGAASFRSELGWRDYGTNLIEQMPDYPERNGRAAFDRFAWRDGPDAERDFVAWRRGQTGYPVIDAGMRELWQTGWMHNRVRMLTASFLVKHLLIDWRRGERWFWDTLLDADLGSNTMNWQYVAGTGVDAPVFSRIMAPYIQSEKFDMAGYVRRFVPELSHLSDDRIHDLHAGGEPVSGYADRLIGHEAARARALAAWHHVAR